LFGLGRIRGIERPAIATPIPSLTGTTVVLDSGAKVDAKPEHMVQSAIMGSVYAELMLKIKNPRVGLLNIGEEEITAKTDLAFVGIMPNENVKITEVWENKKAELNDNTIISTVPPHGVKLFEIVL
jgi:hypothetical protein